MLPISHQGRNRNDYLDPIVEYFIIVRHLRPISCINHCSAKSSRWMSLLTINRVLYRMHISMTFIKFGMIQVPSQRVLKVKLRILLSFPQNWRTWWYHRNYADEFYRNMKIESNCEEGWTNLIYPLVLKNDRRIRFSAERFIQNVIKVRFYIMASSNGFIGHCCWVMKQKHSQALFRVTSGKCEFSTTRHSEKIHPKDKCSWNRIFKWKFESLTEIDWQ